VCLTRGYNEIEQYDTLIRRNEAIFKFFGDHYPILLFHEGNIKKHHQDHIKSMQPMEIQFHDISDRWAGGYEGMCRFNMWDVWDVCQYYDYILRIDEDCILLEMETDPFLNAWTHPYHKSVFWAESHSETNATLPQEIERLTGEKREDFYNDKFVYTNVGLSSPGFWRDGEVARVLKEIAFHPGQRKNRWGDLPVLGSLLNIYAPIGTLTGMKYLHLSHNVEITCG